MSHRFVVTSSTDKTIVIWDVGQLLLPGFTAKKIELSPIDSLRGHIAAFNALLMTDNKIITGSGNRTIRVWSIATLTCVCVIEGYHEKGIATLILFLAVPESHLEVLTLQFGSLVWKLVPKKHVYAGT